MRNSHAGRQSLSGLDSRGEGLTRSRSDVGRDGHTRGQGTSRQEAGHGVAAARGGVGSVGLARSGGQVEGHGDAGSQGLSGSDSRSEGLAGGGGDVRRDGLSWGEGNAGDEGHGWSGGLRGVRLPGSGGQVLRYSDTRSQSLAWHDARGEGLSGHGSDVGRDGLSRGKGPAGDEGGRGVGRRSLARSVRLPGSGSQILGHGDARSQGLARDDAWGEGVTRSRGDVGRDGLTRGQCPTGHDGGWGGVGVGHHRRVRLPGFWGQVRRYSDTRSQSPAGYDVWGEGLTRGGGDVGWDGLSGG